MTFTPETSQNCAATASVSDTIDAINQAAKSRGGYHKDYSCKIVSWDDASRGTVGGTLSSIGSNITDTRLYAKDGRSLFTVRSDNWNERLGKTSTSDIAVVADPEISAGLNPRPFTLRDILSSPSKFGNYANLYSEDLTNELLDETVSIRFQTTFLPVEASADGKSIIEFAPEAYNYQTRSDDDPKNLIFLCTSQGLAIQQDGSGSKKLFHHSIVSEDSKEYKRYWLEAESSKHKVGGAQKETKEERDDAISRGKATASVIGVRGMGTRFNALMTIQIPLQQKKRENEREYLSSALYDCALTSVYDLDSLAGCDYLESVVDNLQASASTFSAPKIGKSSAARVSRGGEVEEGKENGNWKGLTVTEPKRSENECITCTVVMYYTCEGGVPSEDDVISAITDLEEMYRSVEDDGRLGDDKFDFMKKELTVKDVIDVKKKLATQPPPKPSGVSFWDIFPVLRKKGD